MPYDFKFPDVGEGIHEGEIVKWLVKEGDKVKSDQSLGEIETDKAIVEMPSPKSGRILKIYHKEGSTIKVGEIMVTILEDGESDEAGKKHLESKQEKKNVPYTGSVVGFLEEAKEVQPIKSSAANPRGDVPGILATPAVRNLAKQMNVDLASVHGSGVGGRITIEDVQKAKSSGAAAKKDDIFGDIERVPLKGVRKAMANRMAESIFTSAQLTHMHECDVTELALLREKEKSKGNKLTFMPYIVKAITKCLQKHPYLNSSLENGDIILKKYYNIGIAVDTGEGLFVPVVKGTDKKDLKAIAKEIERVAKASKERKIDMMDLKGGTFSISNLGNIGIEFFTPIIHYPESAIMGVGKITEKPVARNGKVEIRKIMPLSLTYDHRIIDGAEAARFMADVMKTLEKCEF